MHDVQLVGIVAGMLLVAILGFREFRWPGQPGWLGRSAVAVAAVVVTTGVLWIVISGLRS